MTDDASPSASTDDSASTNTDPTTRWAFNFFMGALGMALLGALWMLVQMALA